MSQETTGAKKSFFENPLLSTKVKSAKVKIFPEAGLGYLLGPLLALVSNGVINVWLIQYWDKVLMLGEWNPLFETLLPIISAILVVAGNLLVGKLMERKPSIAGKARPLILLSIIPVSVAMLIMFIVPISRSVWASVLIAVGYNLYYALAWPIYFTSHSALVNMSTRDGGARGLLSTCIMVAQLGASGVAGMAGGWLVDWIGLLPTYKLDSGKTTNVLADAGFKTYEEAVAYGKVEITVEAANSKWTILMIVMIVALVIGCLLEYYFTRERITEEKVRALQQSGDAELDDKSQSVSMSDQIKICAKDKYWWLIMVFFFLYQFGGQMKNNDMSFYSQAMTGDAGLSSTINTVGAIPTALGMLVVWPLANKFTKSKTIIYGSLLAFAASLLSLVALLPGLGTGAITGISVASFCIKALGTAPAMYLALALLANVLDHQEAIYGKRTDGFSMAVYGSIMVAMSGVCNGIIVGFNSVFSGESGKLAHTILGFVVEGVCYLVMAILFFWMNVEKYTELDNEAIAADQKAEAEAKGLVYVPADERLALEEEENKKAVRTAELAELKANCEKKGLDWDEQLAAYEANEKQKAEADAKKKADAEAKKEAKKKADEEKAAAAYAALSDEQKAAFDAKKKAKEEALEAKKAKIASEYQILRDENAAFRASLNQAA